MLSQGEKRLRGGGKGPQRYFAKEGHDTPLARGGRTRPFATMQTQPLPFSRRARPAQPIPSPQPSPPLPLGSRWLEPELDVALLEGGAESACPSVCMRAYACATVPEDSRSDADMSVAFVPERLRGKAEVNQETIQRLLEENDQLIRCIVEYQNKGRAAECTQYQHVLHRNLIYLATIADASPANAPKTVD
uniref:SS18 N-terminal domain-containing protein n=4 Tax=Metatheria TaxID=9263 RepID=F7BIF2_MONDO